MSFSQEWDEIYLSSEHLSIWPWSDVVSYICRYAQPTEDHKRVLELGCGAGANIAFFLSRGDDYYSIEGSPSIVTKLHEKYPSLKEHIKVGDFTKAIPFDETFDVVIDRISLGHNSTAAIESALKLVSSKLRTGGMFMAFDWFSNAHQDANLGIYVDSHTRRDLPETSHLAGTGIVHFSDREHLLELATEAGLEMIRMEHKTSNMVWPDGGPNLAWWNFIAVKR